MRNNKLIKYIYLFIINLFKLNRYKFLNYDIFLKNYRFNIFIKSIKKKYSVFSKLKYPKNLKTRDFEIVSKNSFKESDHLKNAANSTFFFYELNSFFNNDYFICLNSTLSKKLLDSFHLFPPNIFVLDKMFDLYNEGKIGSNYVVDFPCGITNFHQYLSLIYDDELLIGVDNFSQISKKDVAKYQKNLKEFKIYENINNPELKDIDIDVVVSISIEIKEITSEILRLNPKYIFIGSSDLNHDLNNLEKFLNQYKIKEVNHAYILLKK
tara:strand:- start:8701 stop:9501 length:801 start_codon:yes stop_codon:yes gene_type:complete